MQIILQLLLAAFLGALVGLEREYKQKEAGLQTYSLVALGSCLFTIISFEFFNIFLSKAGVSFDPSRIIQAVAIGIGFIGAGVIVFRRTQLEGLTTAAGLWTVAAVGMAIGSQLYFLAVLGTLVIIGILAGLGLLEEKFFKERR